MWFAVTALSASSGWLYYAAVDPTIGAALIAAAASLVQALILLALSRRVNRRLDEQRELVAARRNVFVKGTPDDPHALIVTGEERRAIEREDE